MASAADLKAWDRRKESLEASIKLGESFVNRAALDLAEAQNNLANIRLMLAQHIKALPKLTKKQAAKMLTGTEIRWLRDLLSGPDHIPDDIHDALAARGYVIRQGSYTVITDSGRAIAEKLR
jgi:hypothetical protein